ncbi:unnamed protein product [Xylocopa violacea]|uniref:Uncharacterized protein n=1 Tax=Xylocopa violacea TaxID=135666 RepID=A0ABP1PBT8_XYLVO
MIYVCELLTEEPEGGSAMIPLRTFIRLYEYLAKLDCSGECPCVITEEDTKELFRPGGPSVSEESSSTFDSRLYLATPGAVEEEEDTGLADVCGLIYSESRSSETVRDSKDQDVDARHSEADEAHQGQLVPLLTDEIEVRSMDREEQPREREPETEKRKQHERTVDGDPVDRAAVPDFRLFDTDYDPSDRDVDSFLYDDAEEFEGERESREEMDDYSPIGLESILHGICECLEPVRVSDRVPTPPPPDPLEEFLKRMRREVDEGRLETRLRLEGIGRPVSENRITAVGLWLAECARRQEGLVGPRNIRHFLCPDLEDREDNECAA